MRRNQAMLALLISLGLSATAWAEHPRAEHPKQEHPSLTAGLVSKAYAAEKPAMKDLTIEDLSNITVQYAKNKAGKNAYFSFKDKAKNQNLQLKLIKVHKEKLAKLGEGKYFVCADFKRPDGIVHDLDMFVEQSPKGIRVYDVTVHKDSGKPRYNWVEKAGIWKREPLKTGT